MAKLAEEREQRERAVLEALASERYLALLERFSDDLASRLDSARTRTSSSRTSPKPRPVRLRKAYEELGPEPEDDELHAVRIKAKRARYAAELAAQAEGKPLRKLADAARELQDVIGSNQDAVVAEARVRALAGGRSSFAAGRIVELERARRREAREQLPGSLEARQARDREGLLATSRSIRSRPAGDVCAGSGYAASRRAASSSTAPSRRPPRPTRSGMSSRSWSAARITAPAASVLSRPGSRS